MPEKKTIPRFVVEPLGTHDRKGFHCGLEPLDRYFVQQAGQEARKRVAAPFVLIDVSENAIIGYYTLSMSSVLTRELPADFAGKLPRYEALPAVLLGRIAVDQLYQGQGFGETLLYDALKRSLENPIAAAMVVVDAINEQARAFYLKHDFLTLPDYALRLYLPMKTVERIFQALDNA